jgi:hypothetical protein
LTILTDGAGVGQIDVVGTDARYGGVVIGSITGPGTISSGLVVRLNANATVAATQALLRRLAFANEASILLTGSRTVRVYLTDGTGGTSLPVTVAITAQSVNAPPTVTLPNGGAAWTEHASATLLDPNATVNDTDSTTFNGGNLSVSMSDAVDGDRLRIRVTGVGAGQVALNGANVLVSGIAVGVVSGGNDTTPLTVTFTAQSTPAAAQAILRATEFLHVGQFTAMETRTVEVSVSDGIDSSSTASMTVTLTPVDDPPTTSDITLATVVDIPVQVTLPGHDPEAGLLTWEILTLPTAGTLTLLDANSGSVRYSPALGQTIDTSFTYRVGDGITWSAPATGSVRLTTTFSSVRPLIVSAPAREAVIGATYTYVLTVNVSALPPGADLIYQIVNPPAGATVAISRTTATTATLTWDQTGAADVHRQVGVLVSDTITATASYQPVQLVWLAVAPGGPG